MHKFFQFIAASNTVLLLAACQSFNHQPLDLPVHDQKWRAQNPDNEKVRAFARRVAKSSSRPSTFNPSNGISLPEGKMISLVYNPDLRVARLKAGVAKAEANFAGLWSDPELSLDILRVTEGVPDPWIIGSSLAVTVPLSGRLSAEKQLAETSFHVALERVLETEWKVTIDLQKSWVRWSALHAQFEQTKEVVKSLNSIVKSTQLLAEQGEISSTEARLFTIEQASRRAEAEHLKGEIKVQEQMIRSLLGLSPNAPIHLIPNLALTSWKASENRLSYNNPTINRLRREYEVSERTLMREIRKQYPDLTIGPQAESDEGQSRIGFIGAIPLPILNANKGGIAKARAEREVARATYETEYERKVGQLASARARLRGIRDQQLSLQKSLIPLVDRQVSDAQKLVQLGEGGSLILLESIVRAHEAKLKIITTEQQRSLAESDVQFLLGPTNHKSNPTKN